jgi:hypothetical protein
VAPLFGSLFDTKRNRRKRGYSGYFLPIKMLTASSEIPASGPANISMPPTVAVTGPPRATIPSPIITGTAMSANAIRARLDLGLIRAIRYAAIG